MKRLWLAALLFPLTLCAQTTVEMRAPEPNADIPLPFDYPDGFGQASFELPYKPAGTLTLGGFAVELGKTRLSEVSRPLKSTLYHAPNRDEFLCFSAKIEPEEIPEKDKKKNRKKDDAAEEPAPEEYQNIWLMLGSRGQIREVRAEVTFPGMPLCPRLPDGMEQVRLAGLKLGLPSGERTKLLEVEPTASDESTGWSYWFSQEPSSQRKDATEINLFAVQEVGDRIVKMISVVEHIANSN
jgi:hypothetical protein